MRAAALVASALLVGCATTAPRGTAAAPGAPDPLHERAAALFDAAAHGDELQLKTMVDWARWRTLAGLQHSGGDAQAAEVLSRIEAEPTPGARFVDDAAREACAQLAAVTVGTLPPRPRPGVMNATLAAWRRGPTEGTPPSLARLQTLAAESLESAREVTFDGARRVTLVFVGNMLAAVLEAR